jgi:hypothetical protein
MTDLRSRLRGLWLPLVTPFRDGELDDHPNIAGLKDCCAIHAQSMELLRRRPA